ncbi:uncharacterized protein LOC131888874 [Tigriopus californicus]|nr:uncharacterized protein LOC131888874 [Tigriopus californicus]|eukprot:TCALIF_03902-PA protein Name:"Similar to cep135 Centrosomal protein of 135 kDa (Danio rerio)" AED:0.16 eAED:0.16 QI:171/1/1/1/0.87/0.77/9/84/994
MTALISLSSGSSKAFFSKPGQTFEATREQLDELGYFYTLSKDSLPLVQALLKDLFLATKELKRAKDTLSLKETSPAHFAQARHEETGRALISPPTLQEDIQRQQIHDLQRELSNLKLLNAQSAGVIQSLKDESLAKSNKILDMEMSTHRAAKVVVRSAGIFKPRLEMSSLVSKSTLPRCLACSSQRDPGLKSNEDHRAKIDLIRLYDRRSQNLKKELVKCQSQLSHAHQLLKKAEREIEFRAQPGSGPLKARRDPINAQDIKHSDYILKLIKDNERLKSLVQKHHIAQEDLKTSPLPSTTPNGTPHHSARPWSETRPPFHHRPLGRHRSGCPLNVSRSCEDIREAVQKSHQRLFLLPPPLPSSLRPPCCSEHQPTCGPTQPRPNDHDHPQAHSSHHGPILCPPNNGRSSTAMTEGPSCCAVPALSCPAHWPHPSLDKSNEELNAKLQKAATENKELTNRLKELNQVRLEQKGKIDELSKQQAILLNTGKGPASNKQVQELVGYIEKQRDIYKSNVEQLLTKLDPDKKFETPPETSTDQVDRAGTRGSEKHLKVLKEIQNDSRKILQARHQSVSPYRSSPYKSVSPLRSDDPSHESREHKNTAVRVRMANLQEEVLDLSEQVSELKLAKARMQEGTRQETQRLENLIQTRDAEIQTLKAERAKIEEKSDYRDELLKVNLAFTEFRELTHRREAELNDEISNLQRDVRDLDEALTKSQSRINQDTLAHEGQVRNLEEQLELLRAQLAERQRSENQIKARETAEKAVGLDLKMENCQLKDRVFAMENAKEQQERHIRDLSGQIQRYVNEVKRVEELLAHRETERSELLQQYKSLSVEIDTSETLNRSLEAKVESMSMELREKNAELEASHRRLSDLEKDLIEVSLLNENHRSQVATLSTRLDLANSRMKEAQSQSTWINADLTDVHDLAIQLNSQKVELQGQISNQANEIEGLNGEIEHLRQEVESLSRAIRDEREKSRHLEDLLGHDDMGRSKSQR